MKTRQSLVYALAITLCVFLSSCALRGQEASPDDAGSTNQTAPIPQDEEIDSQDGQGDSTAEPVPTPVIDQESHAIVGNWRLSYYVNHVDGREYTTEPEMDVYYYFDPSGYWLLSYELLDYDALTEDDYLGKWRVTGPATGEYGVSDELTTLSISDDGMLTIHAEWNEGAIPDRVCERV